MPLDREVIRAALEQKGFRRKRTNHDYYHLYVDEKKQNVFTKLSRSPKYKVYSDELTSHVAHQLGLTKKELFAFVDCTIEHNDHVLLLKERNRIS